MAPGSQPTLSPAFATRSESRTRPDRAAADPAQFIARVRAFQLELLQIDQGKFTANGVQARIGEMLVSRAEFGPATVQTWTSPPQSLTLAAKTTAAAALWHGVDFRSSDILLAGPNTAVELVSKPGFGIAAMTFLGSALHRAAEQLGPGIFDGKPILMRSPALAAVDELRTLIDALLLGSSAPGYAVAAGPLAESEGLLRAATRALGGSVEIGLRNHGARRAQAVDRALPAIRKKPTEHLNLADLCRITGASERTLRIAFVERYTVPPARFMKAYRLNHLREDLAGLAAQGPRISQIANVWGFWHLGQLAQDYNNWFGELPSATYRRNLRQQRAPVSARREH
jgi:AraC family transcriptional regulator, ethanolamine operon transcriptional activator